MPFPALTFRLSPDFFIFLFSDYSVRARRNPGHFRHCSSYTSGRADLLIVSAGSLQMGALALFAHLIGGPAEGSNTWQFRSRLMAWNPAVLWVQFFHFLLDREINTLWKSASTES